MADPHNLDRFVQAQEPVINQVREELLQGRKQSHWMWFIFPQISGLGRSEMAQRYAIASLPEAQAYLAHPVLGSRLIECTGLVNQVTNSTVGQIFGSPDDLKFHSSMTLFAAASPSASIFEKALEKYFAGTPDGGTLEKLQTNRNL